MGLISRRQERKQDSGAPPGEEGGQTDQVEVTIAGPDADRLGGLIDMAAIAETLRRRAAPSDPPAKDG